MDLNEARDLLDKSELWTRVRDAFLQTGSFHNYPSGDLRRLELLAADERAEIDRWLEGVEKAAEWRCTVDGAKVRELKKTHAGVYPEVPRYEMYFTRVTDRSERLKLLLKLRFPAVWKLVNA